MGKPIRPFLDWLFLFGVVAWVNRSITERMTREKAVVYLTLYTGVLAACATSGAGSWRWERNYWRGFKETLHQILWVAGFCVLVDRLITALRPVLLSTTRLTACTHPGRMRHRCSRAKRSRN